MRRSWLDRLLSSAAHFFNENPIGRTMKAVVEALPNGAKRIVGGKFNDVWLEASPENKDEYSKQLGNLKEFLQYKADEGYDYFDKNENHYFMDDRGYLYIAEKPENAEKPVWRKLKREEYKAFGKINIETGTDSMWPKTMASNLGFDAALSTTKWRNDGYENLETRKNSGIIPAGKPVGAAVLHDVGNVTAAGESFVVGGFIANIPHWSAKVAGRITQVVSAVFGIAKLADMALASVGAKTVSEMTSEVVEHVQERAEDAIAEIRTRVRGIADHVQSTAEEAVSRAEAAAREARQRADELAQELRARTERLTSDMSGKSVS